MACGQKAWLWSVNPLLPLICLVTMGTCASASWLVRVGGETPCLTGVS